MCKFMMTAVITLSISMAASAHDTWVQTNTNVIRTGDAVHVDLMLGNHGNNHRDFKLASKISLDGVTLRLHGPKGTPIDLASRLVDVGYTPKEGFWTTKIGVTEPGLYLIEQHAVGIVNHGKPIRSVRSAKTFFVAAKSLAEIPHENPGFDKVLGHGLELIPEANTVTPMGPDVPIRVKVLFEGKPLAGAKVSFIPRGIALSEGFDATYERTTNDNGRAMFSPKEGNYYLVVVHHETPEKGTGYESCKYAATLTVFVPDVCPCCGE